MWNPVIERGGGAFLLAEIIEEEGEKGGILAFFAEERCGESLKEEEESITTRGNPTSSSYERKERGPLFPEIGKKTSSLGRGKNGRGKKNVHYSLSRKRGEGGKNLSLLTLNADTRKDGGETLFKLERGKKNRFHPNRGEKRRNLLCERRRKKSLLLTGRERRGYRTRAQFYEKKEKRRKERGTRAYLLESRRGCNHPPEKGKKREECFSPPEEGEEDAYPKKGKGSPTEKEGGRKGGKVSLMKERNSYQTKESSHREREKGRTFFIFLMGEAHHPC